MQQTLHALLAVVLLLQAGTGALAAPPRIHARPYGRGAATYHPTVDPPYQLGNQKIRLAFNVDKGLVFGETTTTLTVKRDGLSVLPFDSVALHYNRVVLDGDAAAYNVARDKLLVKLSSPARAGQTFTLVTSYWTHPARGIYFIRPDRAYPRMQPEIWSQGEMEDNRRWFPTWDEPNNKETTEIIATVPRDWTVIANGLLVSVERTNRDSTWDWRETRPHSTYLTAFSAGPYVRVRDSLGALPVDYYVSSQDARLARLCFGRTPQMIAFFQSKIGIAFPWEKYAQTAVQRFTAGGMENASATTETQSAIHPAQYEPERPCDGLVSHELSHQWWGDDVTTPDWPNIWINEGFATYFEELWAEHHFGKERFDYERYHAQEAYFRETRRYWRPIVDFKYALAADSFDASGYDRPGQVLHMLRYLLGDNAFWKALHEYLQAYQFRNADTRQFEAAVEQSSGKNLRWFFNQWFYAASYPHYYVKQHYAAATHMDLLDVRQKNHGGVEFAMPVDIQVWDGAHPRTVRALIGGPYQRISIAGVGRPPSMVLFDPGQNILRKLDFQKSAGELAYQAQHAPLVPDRLWALDQLAHVPKGDVAAARGAVRSVALHDSFYGVRSDAMGAAAALDDANTLRLALRDPDSRVQIAAALAVGDLKHAGDTALITALRSLTRSSEHMVAAAAYTGLGATKASGSFALLAQALQTPSFGDVIARGAVKGLAAGGDLRAIPLIESHARYGIMDVARPDAIDALGVIGQKRPELVLAFLEKLARDDQFFRARRAAVQALGGLGSARALPTLRYVQAHDNEEGVRSAAWDATADIRDSLKAHKRVKAAPAAKKKLVR